MRRTGYSGISKIRRTLRRADPEITEQLRNVMERGATAIETDILINGREHHITGDMLDAVAKKAGRDGLTYLIGPGAKSIKISKNPFDTTQYVSGVSKWRALQFFKAYWIEYGTKGRSPYRNRKGTLVKGTKRQPARPFVNPAYDMNRDWIAREAKAEVVNVIRRLTSGGTDQSTS